MPPNLEVVVGTYEQFLLGYTVDDIVNKYKLEQTFATHSHLASIRSVTSSKHYLASAAADDTVCLYDLRTRTESGKLVHHTDTVNSINFTPDGSHILTVSSDGTIGIVRCGNWQVEKHWLKAHKGFGVDTLAVHPTGKIAMTTGHDGVLRTWNLVKGRQAYATNLVPRWKLDAKNISVLKWSPSGNCYLLGANNKIDVYSIETAGIKEELSFDSKVVCAEYLNEEYIAVGLSDGKISIYNLESSSQCNEIQAHDARVKCLAKNEEILVSASSSGEIKLWSFKKDKLTLLNQANCNARISCITLASYENLNSKKEEVDLEKKVAEKLSNKLRLKQQVIIEQEEDESNKTKKGRMSKKKRDKLKARKSTEDSNDDDENTVQIKKIKTKNVPQLSPKKKKNIATDSPFESQRKKKKLSVSEKKRKSPEPNDNDNTELPKKKKKANISTTTEVNDEISTTKKKRKNPLEDVAENLPKKQKAIDTSDNVSVKKKRKKKIFKNKIPR